eukprot:GEMP01064717.1.p1 GENE.GEMP01064717.1~~GEMP01064717.1.p1  ORF type:complete len:282 (-),score=57.37 GEMP01064717.1:338-1183(-)
MATEYDRVDNQGGEQGGFKTKHMIMMGVGALILVAAALGFILPRGCGKDETAPIAGFQEAESKGLIMASGAKGDDRAALGGKHGSLTMKDSAGKSTEYVLQSTLKNGRAYYKATNGCTIEYGSFDPDKWETICDNKVQYASYFQTAAGPTDGWMSIKGVTDAAPSVELKAGILLPEASGEKLVRGAFVTSGQRHGRLKYENKDGCQMYFHENASSQNPADGEWRIMCWGEWCHKWQVLYKVPETEVHQIPPLSGWLIQEGEMPAPTFAVIDAKEAIAQAKS